MQSAIHVTRDPQTMILFNERMQQYAQQTKYCPLDELSTNEQIEVLEKVYRASKETFKANLDVLANAPSTLTPDINRLFELLKNGKTGEEFIAAQNTLKANAEGVKNSPAAVNAKQEAAIREIAQDQFYELLKLLSPSDQCSWTTRWLKVL